MKISEKLGLYNEYRNPLYYWWKVRKLFKRPKFHLYVGKKIWFFGIPVREDFFNPIIGFRISGLGWKWKFDEVRHEWDPYILIRLFRKWDIIWTMNWVKKNDRNSYARSMATWEAILDYLYKDRTLKECVKYNQWGPPVGEKGKPITIINNLTKYGKHLL